MCVFTYTWIETYQGLIIFISKDGKWEFQEKKIEHDKRCYGSTLPEFFKNIYSCIVYIKVFLKIVLNRQVVKLYKEKQGNDKYTIWDGEGWVMRWGAQWTWKYILILYLKLFGYTNRCFTVPLLSMHMCYERTSVYIYI